MFIELTDHLRCPGDHPEAYLVLLPSRMEGRNVMAGHLGCPQCGWAVAFDDGVVRFGGGAPSVADTVLTADAVAAFLGISGPGGYVALVGSAARVVPQLGGLLPGVGLVAINPPSGVEADGPASVLHAGRMPIKRSSMRGVVLGGDAAADRAWVEAAAAAVLPGLRIVVEGEPVELPGLEVLAAGGGVWVARRGK